MTHGVSVIGVDVHATDAMRYYWLSICYHFVSIDQSGNCGSAHVTWYVTSRDLEKTGWLVQRKPRNDKNLTLIFDLLNEKLAHSSYSGTVKI